MRKNLLYCVVLLSLMASFYGCGGISSRNVPLPGGGSPGGDVPGVGSKFAFVRELDATSLQAMIGTIEDSGLSVDAIGTADIVTSITLSPNGQKVAYEIFDVPSETTSLYTANSDGSSPITIASDMTVASVPAFSPDSSKVLWAANNVEDNNWDLMMANADGTGLTNLTSITGPAYYLEGSFSPDGNSIAAAAFDGTYYNIWVLGLDGVGTQITTNVESSMLRFPVFSPDGSSVYFSVSDSQGNAPDVVSIPVAGGSITTVTNTSADWVPRFVGSLLTTQSFRDNADELYIMNADGSEPFRLTTNTVFDGFVSVYSYIQVSSDSASAAKGAAKLKSVRPTHR